MQRAQQKEDVFRAAQMVIPTTIRHIVKEEMIQLHANGELEKSHELFKAFDLDGIFLSNQSFSPWEQNKDIETLQNPLEFLKALHESWLEKVSSIPCKGKYSKEIESMKKEYYTHCLKK